MQFKSINPFDGREIASFQTLSKEELEAKLNLSQKAFEAWRYIPLNERCALMKRAGAILREGSSAYAEMISLEMGKPIKESEAEIAKCAWVCDYYAENAASFLAEEIIETEAQKSFVRHDPIGAVFAIMPWNFPFWQVFRFAAPTLCAGNVGLLKHAPNVLGCAQMIEDIFIKAGFPLGVFQNLIVHHEESEEIIKHPAVQAVTLTGSERAGSAVAALAGKYLKKSLLELGGSNAFVVWEDADIDAAVKTALTARMLNCGQSCIAAKRFILLEGIHDLFIEKFIKGLSAMQAGDPLKASTDIGPLARKDLADQLQKQIQDSLSMGAKLLWGGKQDNCYHEPTVLSNVSPEMPAFNQESFGPLAAFVKAKDIDEAFDLAGQSRYGLGLSVCTTNTEKALAMADRVADGAFFINELVKSDPRLPFGGTKLSGYGRELAKDGMMEFINRKTVYLK